MSAQDTLNTQNKKLEQVKSIIGCLCSNDHFTELSSETVSGNLWAIADLIEDLQQLSSDLWEQMKQSKPDAPVKLDRVDLFRTLNEALSMADHSIDLIQCVRADLAGKPRPPHTPEPEKVLP